MDEMVFSGRAEFYKKSLKRFKAASTSEVMFGLGYVNKNNKNYKLDLPGGTIEFNEKPVETLKRELKEETGIDIKKYNLYDTDSISFEWKHNNDLVKVHHIGIFYKINEYKGEIKKNQIINEINDDSKGAEFYKISELKKENLSEIVILILNKLGYKTSNE